jgi:hypothetical protein
MNEQTQEQQRQTRKRATTEEFIKACMIAQAQDKVDATEHACQALQMKPNSFAQRFRREWDEYPEIFDKHILTRKFKKPVGREPKDKKQFALELLTKLQLPELPQEDQEAQAKERKRIEDARAAREKKKEKEAEEAAAKAKEEAEVATKKQPAKNGSRKKPVASAK